MIKGHDNEIDKDSKKLEIWTCVPGGKDSQPLKRKGLKNAVLQDDAALQVSKFFENPLGACMYFAGKKKISSSAPL